eukprot:scaffold110168_cov58-Phaeocystis_antarctica.AAC.3
MFHVIISLGLLVSVGVGLWDSRGLGLSPARGDARAARGARGGETRARGAGAAAATRNWSASHVAAAIISCFVLRHAHAPGGHTPTPARGMHALHSRMCGAVHTTSATH